MVQVMDIDNDILNNDIETEVLHIQNWPKFHAQLEMWCLAYNVENC